MVSTNAGYVDIWVVGSLTFVKGLSQIDFGSQANNTEQSLGEGNGQWLGPGSSGKTKGTGATLPVLGAPLGCTH